MRNRFDAMKISDSNPRDRQGWRSMLLLAVLLLRGIADGRTLVLEGGSFLDATGRMRPFTALVIEGGTHQGHRCAGRKIHRARRSRGH